VPATAVRASGAIAISARGPTRSQGDVRRQERHDTRHDLRTGRRRRRHSRHLFWKPPVQRLRPRLDILCGRDGVRSFRHWLPLQHVAAPPTDPALLAKELAALFLTAPVTVQYRQACLPVLDRPHWAEIHSQAVASPLGGTLVHILGVCNSGAGYF